MFLDRWKPKVPGNPTYVYLLAFGLKGTKELAALNAYYDFAERVYRQHKGAFVLSAALAGSSPDDA